MEKIISEKDSGGFGSEDLILCYLKEIVIKLIRQKNIDKKNVVMAVDRKENDLVSYVKGYINANICKKLLVPNKD